MNLLLRLVLLLLCLVWPVLSAVRPASAQGGDRLDIKTLDTVVFSKRKIAHLCVLHDGRQVVDKEKLRFLLNFNYEEEKNWSSELAGWLNDYGSKYFEVHRGLPPKRIKTSEFFSNPEYYIECHPGGSAADGGGPTGGAGIGTDWLRKVIVRKAPGDIKAKSDDISKVNAATLSFTKDDVAKTTAFSGEGLIGIAFSGSSAKGAAISVGGGPYWYSFVPYLYTKQFNLQPDSKGKPDVSYLMPGLASNVILVSPDLRSSLAIQFDAATTIDQGQSSQHSIATLRLSPSFTVGEKRILRSPLTLFGNLALYPELTGVVREFFVHDAGTNKDLLDKSTFTSLGYDATALLYWTDSESLLSSFVLKAGYIYRATTQGGLDINRWTAGVTIAPFATKNVTIEAEHISGPDENTFKDEQRWMVGLGIRY